MKNLLVILFSMTLFLSCSDDEVTQTPAHVGVWNLTNISGSIAGVNDDIPLGDIVWDFMSDGTLIVANNFTGSAVFQGLDSGTYTYRITFNSQGEYLNVDDGQIGEISIQGDQMSVGNYNPDGIIYQFTR